MILTKNNIKFRDKIRVITDLELVRGMEKGDKVVYKLDNNSYYLIKITNQSRYNQFNVLAHESENIWV